MKVLFESLLTELESKGLMDSAKKAELVKAFESKVEDITKQSFEKAVAVVDEDHAAKLQKALDMMDEDHAAKMQEIVDLIDEDHAEKFEAALEAIDDKHTDLLEKVISKIDEDHAAMLQDAVDKIDEDHSEKLKTIYKKYDAETIAKVEENVSKFLDAYLKEATPEEKIVDAAKLQRLESMFEQVKNMCFINSDYVQGEIKEAIVDAKAQLDAKDSMIDKLMLERAEFVSKIEKNEARTALEKKTKDVSPKLRAFLEVRFKDSKVSEIEEKFDEAAKAFADEETATRDKLVDAAKPSITPAAQQITEGVIEEGTKEPSTMDAYVSRINRFAKNRK